jgi:outer membrane protein OmpA-like peptidoglycan-associated protein
LAATAAEGDRVTNGLTLRARRGIVLGGAVPLIAVTSWWAAGRIENDLQHAATAAMHAASVDGTVVVDGRDAVIEVRDATRRDLAVTAVAVVPGIREVSAHIGGEVAAPSPTAPAPSASATSSTKASSPTVTATPRPTPSTPPRPPVALPSFRPIRFASGSDRLEGTAQLRPVVDYLLAHPGTRLHVSGHTDNRGSLRLGWALSEARARAVARFVVAQGVARSRVIVKWYAQTKPIATNATAAGRALNRRVDVSIEKVA